MEKYINLAESLGVIKNVADNSSWFRDTPHRWALASLPLAYAVACVEVVSKMSDKAEAIYQQIIEAWGKPGVKEIYEEFVSDMPSSKIEEIKQALIHPENALLPDPNKPFKDIEKIFANIEINDELITDGDDIDCLAQEKGKHVKEVVAEMVSLIMEFIKVGFNRESDLEKGRCRVLPSEKYIWLILAIVMRTSFEYANITLEKMRRAYKVRKYKGKTVDFHEVLTEQPMSRLHRRMVANGKKVNLKLKNDRIFMEAAHNWYQCRVTYSSINKFCDAEYEKGIILDPKNVDKQIRPCDEAVGYQRRSLRKPSS